MVFGIKSSSRLSATKQANSAASSNVSRGSLIRFSPPFRKFLAVSTNAKPNKMDDTANESEDFPKTSSSLRIEVPNLCPSIPKLIAPGNLTLVMRQDRDQQGQPSYSVLEKQLMTSRNSHPAARIQFENRGEKLVLRDEFGHLSAKVVRRRCRYSGKNNATTTSSIFKYKVYATRPIYDGQKKNGPAMYLWADIKAFISDSTVAIAPNMTMYLKQPEGSRSTKSSTLHFESFGPFDDMSLRLRGTRRNGWVIKAGNEDGNIGNDADNDSMDDLDSSSTIAKSVGTTAASLLQTQEVSIVRNDMDPGLILTLLAIANQFSQAQ